jgi:ubiquinone/menaquinone biosynthesis C-methylase UbiE
MTRCLVSNLPSVSLQGLCPGSAADYNRLQMQMLSLDQQEALRDRYAAMRPGWQPSTQVYEDLVASRLVDNGTVLDVGCGRGGVLERLLPRVRFAAGADPDPRSLCEHRTPALALTTALAERLPFASCAFDVVICSWVLEHLRHPESALLEFARVLRQGGSFVFLTPNSRNPIVALSRALSRAQGQLVSRVYKRAEADTFPVVYQANTSRRLDGIARNAGLVRRVEMTVGDPTYLAFSEHFFRLGCLLERITPAGLRVHLVGEYVKV